MGFAAPSRTRDLCILATGLALGACASAGLHSATATPSTSSAGVTSIADAGTFQSPNGKASIRHLARGESAYLGLLEIQASAAVPEHADPSEEFIHVLEGRGELTLDGVVSQVEAGDTIYMPAGAKVSFRNGPTAMKVLQVFAGPEPADKYAAWTAADPEL